MPRRLNLVPLRPVHWHAVIPVVALTVSAAAQGPLIPPPASASVPFYESWWLLVSLVILGIGLLLHRRRVAALKRENAAFHLRLEELRASMVESPKQAIEGSISPKSGHQLNNLLTGILANAELMLLSDPGEPIDHEGLRDIADSARQAAALTRHRTTNSGKKTPATDAEDLGELLICSLDPVGTSVTVLLCDDEAQALSATGSILEKSGYSVLRASIADQAITLAATAEDPIALLLTDVILPGMKGPELAVTLTQQYPSMKVIYMSGYPAEALQTRELAANVLPKPTPSAALLRHLHEVLNSG